MKKIILPILILGFLVALPSFAAEIYVDADNGDNTNGNGSSGAPYQSIVTALLVAVDGDTVYLKGKSTYYYHFLETITISQDNLTITAWETIPTIELLAMMPTFNIEGNNVTINGLYFKTSETYNSSPVGATSINIVDGYQGTTVSNCTFTAGQYAVNLDGNNENVNITNNIINGDLVGGFMVDQSSDVTISGNDISIASNSGTSIYYVISIQDSSNVEILKNKIYGTSSAAVIYLNGDTDTLVVNNLIYNNDDISSGVYATGNTNIYIYNNTFYNNETGVSEDENTNTNLEVKNNIFSGNYYALNVDYNSTGQYDNNLYYNNTCLALNTNVNGTPACYSNIENWQDDLKQDKNSLAKNPKFTSSDANDFSLTASSYAIDSGTDLTQVIDDYAGFDRPTGSYYDIGAYEYQKDFSTKKAKSVKANKKNITDTQAKITWKKQKTATKYYVKLMNANGKKIKLYKKVKKKYKILKNLNPDTKYKVKIRSIRIRNGVTYKAKWSKIISFQTKK